MLLPKDYTEKIENLYLSLTKQTTNFLYERASVPKYKEITSENNEKQLETSLPDCEWRRVLCGLKKLQDVSSPDNALVSISYKN